MVTTLLNLPTSLSYPSGLFTFSSSGIESSLFITATQVMSCISPSISRLVDREFPALYLAGVIGSRSPHSVASIVTFPLSIIVPESPSFRITPVTLFPSVRTASGVLWRKSSTLPGADPLSMSRNISSATLGSVAMVSFPQ